MKITESKIRRIIREELLQESSDFRFDINKNVYANLDAQVAIEEAGDGWEIEVRDLSAGEFGDIPLNIYGPSYMLRSLVPWGAEPGDRNHRFLQSVGFPFDDHPPYETWKDFESDFAPGGSSTVITRDYLDQYLERFYKDEEIVSRFRLDRLGYAADVLQGIRLTLDRIDNYIHSDRVQNIIAKDPEGFADKLERFFSISEINIVDEAIVGGMSAAGFYMSSEHSITMAVASNSPRVTRETTYHEFLHHWQEIFDEPENFDWKFSPLEREEETGLGSEDERYEAIYSQLMVASNIPMKSWLKRYAGYLNLPTDFDRYTVRESMRKAESFKMSLSDDDKRDWEGRDAVFKAFYQFQENHFTMSLRRLFMILNNLGYDLDLTSDNSIERFKEGLKLFLRFGFPHSVYLNNRDLIALPLFLKPTPKNINLITRIGDTLASNAIHSDSGTETV